MLESYRAWNDITDYVYFGGRLLYTLSAGQAVTRIYSDRLGSTRATETIEQFGGGWTTRNYYPFGEEIGSTANNEYKFASTYRDSTTGLDYAINRYYASGMGRFLTPAYPYDPSGPLGVILGLLDTGSPAPACGGGGAISGRGGGAVAVAAPATDGGRGEAPFNILGGLAAAATPRAERSGVPLQQFAAAGSSARTASAAFDDCCDPWDPCCDPWDCDPGAAAMGQRKSAQSVRAQSAGCGSGVGGGGGGGGWWPERGPNTPACRNATAVKNEVCGFAAFLTGVCAETSIPHVCEAALAAVGACAVAEGVMRYWCMKWPW